MNDTWITDEINDRKISIDILKIIICGIIICIICIGIVGIGICIKHEVEMKQVNINEDIKSQALIVDNKHVELSKVKTLNDKRIKTNTSNTDTEQTKENSDDSLPISIMDMISDVSIVYKFKSRIY